MVTPKINLNMPKKIDIDKIFPRYGEKKCEFVLGAHNPWQFPETYLPEFAFIGASNVGKSSLVNALVADKIAITSNTPGRTRQINFFTLSERIMIVDMPGYGFAKANDKHIENWQRTSFEYFAKRKQLKRVFLLIDPTKGIKESDVEMANILSSLAVNFQIVLTKIDRLKKEEFEKSKENIIAKSKLWAALHPEIISVSSKKEQGLDQIKFAIAEILENL